VHIYLVSIQFHLHSKAIYPVHYQELAAASVLNNGKDLRKHGILTVYSPTDSAWNLPNSGDTEFIFNDFC
jgi:hypothetical protein